MNRNFIIGLLIGLLIGTPLIFFGINFLIKDLNSVIRIVFWVGIIVILITSILYLNRFKLLNLMGLNVEASNNLKTKSNELIEAISNGEKEIIKQKGLQLGNQLIGKISEIQFRIWLFRIAFSIIALIGSIVVASIAFKQNEIIEKQNQLIAEQGEYLIKLNEPILDIDENKFELEQVGNRLLGNLNFYLKNFGQRAANNIIYEIRFFERWKKENRLSEIDLSMKEELSNYLSKENSINIKAMYSKENNGNDVLILFDLKYNDSGIETNKNEVQIFFKVPTPIKEDINLIKTSLFNATKEEEKLIIEFLKKE